MNVHHAVVECFRHNEQASGEPGGRALWSNAPSLEPAIDFFRHNIHVDAAHRTLRRRRYAAGNDLNFRAGFFEERDVVNLAIQILTGLFRGQQYRIGLGFIQPRRIGDAGVFQARDRHVGRPSGARGRLGEAHQRRGQEEGKK